MDQLSLAQRGSWKRFGQHCSWRRFWGQFNLGLDSGHGCRNIYEIFYGDSDCISLERAGDKYYVLNSNHGLAAAKEPGLMSIRARVVSPWCSIGY